MRTRSTESPATSVAGPGGSYNLVAGVQQLSHEVDVLDRSTITDDPDITTRWKPCTHDWERSLTHRTDAVASILTSVSCSRRTSGTTDLIMRPEYKDYHFFNQYFTGYKEFKPSDADVAAAAQRCLVNVQANPIQPGMNLPRMILELRDIPKTVRSFSNLAGFVMNPKKALTRAAKLRHRGHKKVANLIEDAVVNAKQRPLATVAGGYLGYIFGIVPTRDDIRQLFDKVAVQAARPVPVSYRAGQLIRSSAHVGDTKLPAKYADGIEHASMGTLVLTPNVPVAPASTRVGVATHTAQTSTAVSSRNRDWPPEALTELRCTEVEVSAFGVIDSDMEIQQDCPLVQGADPLSTLWELIPFSFVVDWFANIGDWLRQQNRLALSRRSGFHLDPDVGLWLATKRTTMIYHPQLEIRPDCSVQPRLPVTSYFAYLDVAYSASRVVRFIPVKEIGHYERTRVSSDLKFVRVVGRGLGDQGLYQLGAASALAVANGEALRALFR